MLLLFNNKIKKQNTIKPMFLNSIRALQQVPDMQA